MAAGYMTVTYGSYEHPGSVIVSRSAALERDQRGRPYLRRWEVTIDGEYSGTTEAGFNTLIDDLTEAYETDEQDMVLEWPSGRDATDLDVDSSETLSGVRVLVPPHNPQAGGSVYAPGSIWTYTLTVEYIEELITVDDATRNVIEFDETLSISNAEVDVSRKVLDETIEGLGELHTVCEKPICHATQSGRVVGWFTTPVLPPPMFPEAQIAPAQATHKQPARRYGTNTRRYEVDYTYTFSSSIPLVPVVSSWPV